jgi:predicted kinase
VARSTRQFLAVMRGMPGTGKSTLGRELGRRLHWPVIDKDDVKDALVGSSEDANRLSYDVMFNLARCQLDLSFSIICDSPLTLIDTYANARRLAHEFRAKLLVVECVCSDEASWRARIEARAGTGLPAHRYAYWEPLMQYGRLYDVQRYPISDAHVVVDTVRPLDEVATQVVAFVQRQRRHWPR